MTRMNSASSTDAKSPWAIEITEAVTDDDAEFPFVRYFAIAELSLDANRICIKSADGELVVRNRADVKKILVVRTH